MKRYKIRKEQLERVVETFVMENNTKKGLNESKLLKEGFGDLVSGMKDAVSNMSKEIMKMAEKDPQVKADLEKAAEQMGGIKEDASLEDLDNAEELLQEFVNESGGLLTEGVVGKLVGRVMQALGLGGLAVSIPAFISMLPGWSDFKWTADLHMYVSDLCGAYGKFCGPLTLLAVALAIVMVIAGTAKKMRS
jgi:hypothetical protein